MRAITARTAALAALALLGAAPALLAQGTLSTQGFGYPPGQLSTRALGTGGATAESDAVSPLNPAALVNWGSSAVFFQANPEWRTTEIGGSEQQTSLARYPLAIGALAIGPRTYIALSSSTLMDRTWATTEEATIDVGGDQVDMTTTFASQGAINDVRFAAGHAFRPWLRVGLGVHAIVGRNRLSVVSAFADSIGFTPIIAGSTISYGGNALSGGAEARIGENWSVTAATRIGGSITSERNDTTLSRADVPTRVGIGLGYLGIRGSMLSVRAAYDGWSSLSGLGDDETETGVDPFVAHDAWDFSAGADVAGPRLGRNVIQLRAGVRHRTLPFEAAGREVKENSFSVGAGTMFANGRVVGDVALVRAARDASDLDASERAWTLSLGLAILP